MENSMRNEATDKRNAPLSDEALNAVAGGADNFVELQISSLSQSQQNMIYQRNVCPSCHTTHLACYAGHDRVCFTCKDYYV